MAAVSTSEPEDTLSSFRAKIDEAKINGEEWVETSPNIIKYYLKGKPLNDHYFWVDSVRVTLPGLKEKIIAKEEESLERRLHGTEGGVHETV